MTRKETDGFWWKSGPRYVSVKIRVRIGLAQGLAPRGCTAVLRKGRRATRNLFSNNFASSAALAEVCALPSAVLVIYFLKYSATRWPYVSLCVAFIYVVIYIYIFIHHEMVATHTQSKKR